MKTAQAIAAAVLTMLFSTNGVSATTYTFNIDYNLLDGTLFPNGTGTQFENFEHTPFILPTLYVGDVINTTINFTQGLHLSNSDPGPSGIQQFDIKYTNWSGSESGIVSTYSQLTLLHTHGDIPTPDVVFASWDCNTCAYGGVRQFFSGSSDYSFGGFNMVTTIVAETQPYTPNEMQFQIYAANIDIIHGASGVSAIPEPSTWAMMLIGFFSVGFVAYRRKRNWSQLRFV